jgi:hypothetical protein
VPDFLFYSFIYLSTLIFLLELETKKLTLDLTEAKAQASRHLCKKFITQPHSIPNSPPEQWHDFIGPHLKEAASLYTIQHLNELHVVDLQLSLLMGLNDTAAFYARHSHLTRYPISLHDKMKLWSPLSSMLGGGYEREMERVRFLKSDLCYVPLAQVRPLLDHALVTIALDMGQSFKLPPKLGMKMQKLSKPW